MGGRRGPGQRFLLASLFLVVSLVALIEWPVRAALLYTSAHRRQHSGDLEGAFQRFDLAADRLPFLAVLRQARDRSATAWAADYHGAASAAGEVRLLRRLVMIGQEQAFAGIVSRSMVSFEAGSFTMGSDLGPADEQPARTVWLSAYRMDRFEVTCVRYLSYLQATGRPAPPYWSDRGHPAGTADRPVVGVSWMDAAGFCAWRAASADGSGMECACRGTGARVYPWGSEWQLGRANDGLAAAARLADGLRRGMGDLALREKAGPHSDARRQLPDGNEPIGSPDLAGNASEWVADWYNWEGDAELPKVDPLGGEPPWNHVVRGKCLVEPPGECRPRPRISAAARCAVHRIRRQIPGRASGVPTRSCPRRLAMARWMRGRTVVRVAGRRRGECLAGGRRTSAASNRRMDGAARTPAWPRGETWLRRSSRASPCTVPPNPET